ncbi:MAG: hypothetical protein U0599_07910 [Vicinamibacteria bacterium]
MRVVRSVSYWLLFAPALAGAADKTPVPPLTAVHVNASRTVRLHTPAGWTVENREGQPEVTEARGDGLIVRILRREGELGLDSLHVECMLVRLAGAMETSPQVDYEYDFVSGQMGERRALDSAFMTTYDQPVAGSPRWRQRNVTLVGGGESVCVIGYAPADLWKKSKPARSLLQAVLAGVELAPWH